VNDLLSRYDRTFRAGRVSDACNILLNIQETHAAFPNMDDVKKKVKDQCSAPPTVIASEEPKTEYDKQMAAAEVYIAEGNIDLANARVFAAAKITAPPNSKKVSDLQDKMQAAKQAQELLNSGKKLFYDGDKNGALKQLAAAVGAAKTSPGLIAQAHFW